MDEETAAIGSNAGASSSVIVHDVLSALRELLRGNISEGSAVLVLKVLVPAGVALLLFIVAYFAARLVGRWTASLVCARVDQTLGKFAGRLTFYGLMILSGMTILQTANVNVAGLAALIAAAGFAIGLAFQGTLGNFASGILLLVFRPFKVGDLINAAGVLGKVNEIDLFTTTLDTPDNRRLIVPNSSIAGTTIENITYHQHRRVDVQVGVAYAASLDQTRRVLTACAESLSEKMIVGEGRGYQVLLTNLGASSVEWTVRVWAKTSDYFSVKETLTATIKRELDLNGLEIPFPQMQLHLKSNDLIASDGVNFQKTLPMPKLNSQSTAGAQVTRVRPRPRGETI